MGKNSWTEHESGIVQLTADPETQARILQATARLSGYTYASLSLSLSLSE